MEKRVIMIGIFLIYFIWKNFSELAVKFNRKKWIYGLLGVASYYLGASIGGIVIGVLSTLFGFFVDWENSLLMSFIALPFGLVSCYAIHFFLEKKWEKEIVCLDSLDDIGKDVE